MSFVLVFTEKSVVWCPCMAIDVSVQYNGGFLPYVTATVGVPI